MKGQFFLKIFKYSKKAWKCIYFLRHYFSYKNNQTVVTTGSDKEKLPGAMGKN